LGGLVSFLYAMAHLSEVTRIVFNDFSLTGDPNLARFVAQRYGRTPAKFVALADALDWFLEEHILDALDDDALEAWVSHFLTPLPAGGFRLNCDPKLLQLMRQSQFYGTADRAPPVLLNRAKLLEMPVMIMRGAESDVVSQDEARLMAESLPAGRWLDVPGAGHSPTLYEPEARTALREFFGVAETD
jgi:pimeloyl-ACP methyl ester carboxylesterase